ncbi:membrane protein [Salmonella enterica subsp. arizonae]|uniref:Membrane protein n=1 Tax=Salmonella enterica subsp. arizonae TaxID=59203 RepID=A0A379T7L7_SALER|nr:membrane protein [Salmonella enterica subsp. arizonae]
MTYRSKVAVVYLLGFFLDLINLFICQRGFSRDVRRSAYVHIGAGMGE